jgi:hypothetical protein
MSDMVKDHTLDVADFKLESSSGTNPDVKHFAATTLPTLQDHLRQAKEIAPTTRNASNNMKGGVQQEAVDQKCLKQPQKASSDDGTLKQQDQDHPRLAQQKAGRTNAAVGAQASATDSPAAAKTRCQM